MVGVLNRSTSAQASSLPLGAHIFCTTTHGDVLRGNVIATGETNEAVVISILKLNVNHSYTYSSITASLEQRTVSWG